MDAERVYKEKNFIWTVKGKSARNVTETMRTNQIIFFILSCLPCVNEQYRSFLKIQISLDFGEGILR